jgi:hypothetical protein
MRKRVAIDLCEGDEMEPIRQLEANYRTATDDLPQDLARIIEEANASVSRRKKTLCIETFTM